MEVSFVVDCLFDLINESDLLDVNELQTAGNTLVFTRCDGETFYVSVQKGGASATTEGAGTGWIH